MRLTIKFAEPFSGAVGKSELKLEFKGTTIKELLEVLVEKHPRLKNELFAEDGRLSYHVIFFVNDEPVNALKGGDAVLKDGDILSFVFLISGG